MYISDALLQVLFRTSLPLPPSWRECSPTPIRTCKERHLCSRCDGGSLIWQSREVRLFSCVFIVLACLGSIRASSSQILEIKLQEHSVRNHSNKKGKARAAGVDFTTQRMTNQDPWNMVKDHPPGLHLLDIGDIGVVFDRHEAKCQTVKELDSVHSKTPIGRLQVDSKRNQLEIGAKNGASNHDGHQSCRESLISDSNHLWRLSRHIRVDITEGRHMADSPEPCERRSRSSQRRHTACSILRGAQCPGGRPAPSPPSLLHHDELTDVGSQKSSRYRVQRAECQQTWPKLGKD